MGSTPFFKKKKKKEGAGEMRIQGINENQWTMEYKNR